jgi:hypothetical protein
MSSDTIKLLVGAGVTIVGGIIGAAVTVFVKEWLERRGLKAITKSRHQFLHGSTWHGTATNYDIPGESPSAAPFEITFHFFVRGKLVTGDAVFHRNEREFNPTFKGGFYDDTHLKLEYTHVEPVIAYGYMILKLEDIPDTMNGKVVAYGALSKRIIVGKVELTKANG